MPQREFKNGDRVIVNARNATYQGRKGTVKYASGGLYWIKFDDNDQIAPSFYPWWLNLLPSEAEANN